MLTASELLSVVTKFRALPRLQLCQYALLPPLPAIAFTAGTVADPPTSARLPHCCPVREQGGGPVSSRDIGRHLQSQVLDGGDALSQLKQRHAGLRDFFRAFPESFAIATADSQVRSIQSDSAWPLARVSRVTAFVAAIVAADALALVPRGEGAHDGISAP